MDKLTIGIIGGTGVMGHWFQPIFEEAGHSVLISGRSTVLTAEELAKKSDIIIVSVPLEESVNVLEAVIPHVRKDSLLTDFSSLKGAQMAVMKGAQCSTLGMHPLFGPLAPSLTKQNIVFCRGKDNSHVSFLKSFFEERGARIVEMDPDEHDRNMAYIQVLTHFSNLTIGKTLLQGKALLNEKMLTPVFRKQLATLGRVLGADATLYSYIETENPYTEDVLSKFQDSVHELKGVVLDGRNDAFVKEFEQLREGLGDLIGVTQYKKNTIATSPSQEAVTVSVSRALLSKMSISFLGPRGTFSHEVLKFFYGFKKSISKGTITDVFSAVLSGETEYGIVPIENSLGGLITETMESLIRSQVVVVGSTELNVSQCLMSRTKDISDITKVISHPQAINQTQSWIQKHLPNIEIETASSTVAPILEDTDHGTAFIGSESAATEYQLNILARDIQDNKTNTTRFYLITKADGTDVNIEIPNINSERTALLLGVKDRPAVLRDILNVFAKQGLNLVSLHSIPNREKKWEYLFFIEIDAAKNSVIFKDSMKEVEYFCETIRIVGRV